MLQNEIETWNEEKLESTFSLCAFPPFDNFPIFSKVTAICTMFQNDTLRIEGIIEMNLSATNMLECQLQYWNTEAKKTPNKPDLWCHLPFRFIIYNQLLSFSSHYDIICLTTFCSWLSYLYKSTELCNLTNAVRPPPQFLLSGGLFLEFTLAWCPQNRDSSGTMNMSPGTPKGADSPSSSRITCK